MKNRRNFLKMVGGGALAATAAPQVARTAAAAPMPTGKIGDLELGRLMLGTNHITFYMHSRGLRYVDELSRQYNTDEKIFETFAAAEAHGINAFMTHSEPRIEKLFKEYRDKRGGKMRWIIAPWIDADNKKVTDLEGYNRIVPRLIDSGADALYVPGMLSGPLVNKGQGELIGEMLNVISASGVPAGVACHGLDVIQHCEKEKMPLDFYVKTFHHLKYPNAPKPEDLAALRERQERHPVGDLKADYSEVPGYWCGDPEGTAAFMKGVTKPWIAFKVMAAGAISPMDGFRYAFENGADFILAGMFDFQIADDATVARNVLVAANDRPRPWCA